MGRFSLIYIIRWYRHLPLLGGLSSLVILHFCANNLPFIYWLVCLVLTENRFSFLVRTISIFASIFLHLFVIPAVHTKISLPPHILLLIYSWLLLNLHIVSTFIIPNSGSFYILYIFFYPFNMLLHIILLTLLTIKPIIG